jgi:hypothetical protein
MASRYQGNAHANILAAGARLVNSSPELLVMSSPSSQHFADCETPCPTRSDRATFVASDSDRPPEVAMSRARELANYRGLPDRIVIPDLHGLVMAAALRQSIEVGFTLAVDDPPAPIKDLASSGRWVVGGQDPAAGETRYRGDTVVVSLRRFGGGEAGDREPRNPLPRPLRSLAERPSDEPVERLGSVHQLDPLATTSGISIETTDQ